LENIGQSIFKSWFVDFEGFENDLVESEMGMIPRGWKVGEVGDYAKIKS
jgi:type I restriction enzyme, S subunit